jgi:ATP/maltotriose-dependent transcriptional regulator MalT
MTRFDGKVDHLTTTESHILALVESGLSNRDIATALSITVGTVKCNLHRVYEKLQVSGRLQAVVKAREQSDYWSPIRTPTSARALVLHSKSGFGR